MHSLIRRLAALSTLLPAAGAPQSSVRPSASAPVVRGQIGRSLDRYLERAAGVGFSGVVLVEWHGDVVLRHAYGWLDRRQTVRPLVSTAYPISSNTKMFTAALAGVLVSQGRLAYTDSIGKFFGNMPPDKRGITIHHLLSHTSGLGNTYAAESLSAEDGVRAIITSPLSHAVGEMWDYSNDGFHLLESALERAGGQSFDGLRAQLLFGPAGMVRTGTDRIPKAWPSVARGRNLLSDWVDIAPKTALSPTSRAGLLSTVDDLHAWAAAWRRGDIVSSSMRKQMFAPHAQVQDGVDQVYGGMILQTPLGRAFRMGGNDTPQGVTSEYRLYLEQDGFLALLNNTMWDLTPYIRRVRTGIESILSGSASAMPPLALDVASTRAARLQGAYRGAGNNVITVWAQGRSLLVGAEGQAAIDALFPSDSTAEIARRAAYTRKAAALVAALITDGTFQDSARLAPLRSVFQEVARDVGTVVTWDTLGTAPTPADDDGTGTTYVRLRGKRGNDVVRIVWSDDAIAAVIRGTPRPYLPVVHLTDGTVAAYSFFDDRSVPLRLSSSEGVPAITLTVGRMVVSGAFRRSHPKN